MSGGSVRWAEAPDARGEDTPPDAEAHGEVDDTFAARRLRRWLKGMFGGTPPAPAEAPSGEPDDPPDESR
jgi:hypothetical protein